MPEGRDHLMAYCKNIYQLYSQSIEGRVYICCSDGVLQIVSALKLQLNTSDRVPVLKTHRCLQSLTLGDGVYLWINGKDTLDL